MLNMSETNQYKEIILNRFDVVKKDMKDLDIDVAEWEGTAADRPRWRVTLTRQLKKGEEKLREAWIDKRQRRKGEKDNSQAIVYVSSHCRKQCYSKTGLFNHKKTLTQGHLSIVRND